MTSRNRFVITAAGICHLILTSGLFTLQARATEAQHAPQTRPIAVKRQARGEPVTIRAREQERAGDLFTLRGNAEIEFRDYIFRADQVTYDARTGDLSATGHLRFDGGPHDLHIEASRGQYNIRTATGRFYDVVGTTGVRFRGRNITLTSSNPFAFSGKLVEKTSPSRFVVHHGMVTSCAMPQPKWSFHAARMVVEIGGEAKIFNSSFRVKGVPVLYLPFAQHPVEQLGRETGFLVPSFGASSRKGTIFGESFYWKINRSMDATAGAEYWSSRGWAQHGEFRARPAEQSYLHATYFGVLDRGFAPARVDQGGQDVKLNLETALPAGFRGVASLNYLSSFVFRLAFTEVFSQAVNSEVKSVAFLSRTRRGYSLNLMGARYQNFQSTAPGDLVLIAHAPSLEFSSVERPLVRSPVYWSLDAAAEGVSRREPLFKTNQLVGRFDLRPRVSLPLFRRGWTVRPELILHDSYYTQRRLPVSAVGVPGNDTVNRRALETALELRPPTLGRIFAGKLAGRRVKHTIEPRFTYRYVTGIDNFSSIIRFDARDILSDTNEIEYALVNRLFLKRPGAAPAASPAQEGASAQGIDLAAQSAPGAQEFISWELAQKYFFSPDFGGAVVVPGKRNVLETTVALTGIAFLTEPRRFSPLVSRLRVRSSAHSDLQWQLDYDNKKGRINASSLFVNYHFGDFFVGGSHVLFHSPGELFVTNPIPGPERFHQFRALVGYGGPGKRGLSAAANVGFDAHLGFLQYSAFQTAYNWDCCGVSMEYRRFALGAVRNENQFRFAFTLANIGTFGNLKRQERVF